ncbi:MAG: ABC transporter ATP-binding protein [Chlamydiales bacterium]
MVGIELENVSLVYPVYGADARSLKTTMLHFATGGQIDRDRSKVSIEALNDVSFRLEKGDRLALIGHNGAGKSTLLKVLAQIYEPTKGTVNVRGQINSLFDIMVGMDQELNAYENIKLRGFILGLSKSEIKNLIPKVEAFSELGDFMKIPIKTYSSGMKIRLAFGIIVNVSSEILLIDEIVYVGDAKFIHKAKEHMRNLVHESDIMVLSSHDIHLTREFCNKALWLERGRIMRMGAIDEVLEAYQRHSLGQTSI